MSEFNDDYPAYEFMSQHSEEDGKKARRTLWNVFWVMLIITLVELVIGFMAPGQGWSGTTWLKFFFITLTIAKAAAIVWWFMHLGHEVSYFKYVILIPYTLLIGYAIFILLVEGTYFGKPENHTRVESTFVQQKKNLEAAHGAHGAAHSDAHAEEGHH